MMGLGFMRRWGCWADWRGDFFSLTRMFYNPHISEIFIVIGSFGVILTLYKILDRLFSISNLAIH
jgi:hypothetical protein